MKNWIGSLLILILITGCLDPKYPENQAYNTIEVVKGFPGTGALKIVNAVNTDVEIIGLKFNKSTGEAGADKIVFSSQQDKTLDLLTKYVDISMARYNQGILNSGTAYSQIATANWGGAANVISAGTGLARELVTNPSMIRAYYNAPPEVQIAARDILADLLQRTSTPTSMPNNGQ